MAIYPKKSKDPTEVALSAIQDALNVRDADLDPPIEATIATAAEASSDHRKRGPRVTPMGRDAPFEPPMLAPPPPDEDESVQAANDDQESIGQILQSLQRSPRSTTFYIATLFTVVWVISALGLMIGFGGTLRALFGDMFTAVPTFFGILGALFAPIIFFYALANMLARSQELRLIAHSMAETTLRFAEPDTMAREFDRLRRPGDPARGRGDGRRRRARAGARRRTRSRWSTTRWRRWSAPTTTTSCASATCSTASPSSAKPWSARPSRSATPSPTSTSISPMTSRR